MEMGRRVNRHRKKRIHIDKMKKRYLRNPFMGKANSMSYAQYVSCSENRNRDIRYWKHYFISGRRRYAKELTSIALRCQWRRYQHDLSWTDIDELDAFDGCASAHGWYRRHYDYAWEIW